MKHQNQSLNTRKWDPLNASMSHPESAAAPAQDPSPTPREATRASRIDLLSANMSALVLPERTATPGPSAEE